MKAKIQSYHTCYVDRENSKPTYLMERKKQLKIIEKSDFWLRKTLTNEKIASISKP